MKMMSALFDSRCRVCGGAISKGESIWYDRAATKGRKALHQRCASQPAQERAAPVRETVAADVPTSGDVHERHFESVSEFCAVPVSPFNARVWDSTMAYGNGSKSQSWYGIEGGYKAAVKTIADGWHAGLKRVEESLDGITAPPVAGLRRRVVRADFGDELDIHRVNSGQFETAWSRKARRMSAFGHAQKTLLVQINASARVDAEVLFWRGAAAVKISDILTDAGYSVEIIGLSCSVFPGKKRAIETFVIKPSDMPLDRLELATVVCLSGFWRSYGFKAICALPWVVDESLGHTEPMTPTRYASPDVICGLDAVTNQQQAQDFINRTIAALSHEDDTQ